VAIIKNADIMVWIFISLTLNNVQRMKNNKFAFTLLLAVTASLFFTACKNDDPQPAIEYETQGYVKGKFTGNSADNTYMFNEDFNYTQYNVIYNTVAVYNINDDGSYSIRLQRADFSTVGFMRIEFELNNASDTSPDDVKVDFNYEKEFNDKIVTFRMASSDNNATTLSEISFNPTTGQVKGKLTLSGSDNSTGNNASVMADFDMIAKRVIQ